MDSYAQIWMDDSNVSEDNGTNHAATNLKSAVPTSSTKSHAIGADAKAAHTVLMAREDTNTFALEGVPHIARPIIIPAEQRAA